MDMTPNTKATKGKVDKWELNFCASKKIINKVEEQPMEWKTIVANDKELIFKIYVVLVRRSVG